MEMQIQASSSNSAPASVSPSVAQSGKAQSGKQPGTGFQEALNNASTNASAAGDNLSSGKTAADASAATVSPAISAGEGASAGSTPGVQAILAALMQLLNQTGSQLQQVPEAEAGLRLVLEQPELLEQALALAEIQQWLMRASELLAAMNPQSADASSKTQVDAAGLVQASSAAPALILSALQTADSDVNREGSTVSSGSEARIGQNTMGTAQAKVVIAGILEAMQAEPKGVLLGQLGEEFNEAAAKLLSEIRVTAEEGRTDGAKTKKFGAALLSHKLSALTASADKIAGSETTQPVIRVEAAPVNRRATALEAMAYKFAHPAGSLTASAEGADAAKAEGSGAATETAPLSPGNQDALRALQSAAAKEQVPVEAKHFAQEMSKFLLKQMTAVTGNGVSEARLLLNPEHLGQVDVRITLQNGQLTASFTAHTSMGREMLESQMQQLRTTLQNQGLQVDRLEVTQGSLLHSGMFQGEGRQQSSHWSGRPESGDSGHYLKADEEFAEEIAAAERVRQAAYGTTVDITA